MGSESYLSDFRTEGAVKLRIPSSFAIESYVNVPSGRVSKGLEDKEESKSNALQLMKLVKKQVVSIKVENENVEETSQGVVAVEEQEDMPELSRLRGDCIVYSSNLSIKPEVECMSRMIHDSRVCSDYENYFPNSLEVKVEEDLTKFGNGLFSPPLPGDCTVASEILNGSSMEGRKRSFPNIESYKSNFDSCCDNAINLDDNTNVDNQQFGRKMNETWQVNSFTSSLEVDISHQAVEEDISGVQHVVHETSCSVQGSTGELLCCSEAERSTFEKPSSVELDSNGATIDSLKMTSTCCSIDTDCFTEEENVPGIVANTCPITSVRRTNPKRGASIRSNLSDGKFNLPIRIQSNRRRCRRKCGASPYCTQEMFSGVKRQMRNSHRKARLSIWGTVEHLLTVIRQRDELIKQDSVSKAARKSRSKKTGRGVNQRKKRTALKCEPSILSSTFIPTSDFHTSSRTSSSMADSEQNLAEKWYASVRSNMIVQPGEKDLESTLTQDICVDNLLSECHGISSRVDLEFVVETGDNKVPSDSGNSPESGVYNPLIDTSMPSATPNFVEPFAVHLPLLTRKIQVCDNRRSPLKSHKRKKTMKEKRERKGNRENKRKREKIGEKIVQISECSLLLSDSLDEGRLSCQVKSNVVKESTMSCGDGGKYSVYSRKHFKIRPDPESFFLNSSVSEITDLDKFNHCLTIQNKTETSDCTLLSAGNEHFEEILPHDYGKKFQGRESTNKVPCKSKSICAGSARHKRKFIYDQQRKNIMTFDSLGKSDDFSIKNDQLDFSTGTTSTVSPIGGVSAAVDAMPKDATGEAATPILSESARKQYDICVGQPSFSEKKAWALCDDCQKWRCVPNELVHAIEKDRWTCKDNVDEAFADCTIPQEKTDEEINNDLGISDEQCYSTTLQSYGEGALPRLAAAAQTMWTRIKSNLFLHRNRRTQAIDEVMVCHCKPPPDGGLGCGEECLNRMLNIECVKGTCPCGNLCSNQQFQKRKYAKFKCLKCGKKGFGLQLEDNVSRGEFLIEYVGEVLDLASYEARLRYYAYRGQKHFYFMTLNGGEVIDACDKGNLGRFINHSCDPNCRTEKWMVNGEVCIGLFALRDIKKGEEITFDYNYVRVFGAAAKKCVCGSAECRGYIGGDPSSSEGIVQDDSDTEDVESLEIEGEIIGLDGMETDSVATNAKVANHEVSSVDWSDTRVDMSLSEQGDCVQKHVLENHDAIHQPSSELDLADNLLQSSCVEFKTDSEKVSDIQPFQEVKQGLSSIQPDRSFYEDVNEDPPFTIHSSLPAGQLSEIPEHRLNTLQQNDHAGHVSFLKDATKDSSLNSASFMHKSSTATYPIEEIRTLSKPKIAVKTLGHIEVKHNGVSMRSAPSVKTKKLPTSISSQHIEGVEEMLNELLDEDGGICRRKDTTRRYLRLLHVTAATGDETKGSMSQSARNLSLILDAMLKTKSRVILVDIINKNGLQMLHNMMKQNRDNFNRTPVLRKLLKVLEFLAEKEILTKEHIFAAAPVSGMESFKESMLKLMKHRDAQVQHIARSFANHWIPRTFHRADPPDRDERQLFPNYLRSNWCQASKFTSWHDQRSSEIDIRGEALSIPTQALSSSTSLTDINPIETENSHKHKCQWDQPAVVKEQASEYSADQFMLCCSSSKNLMRPSQLEPVSDNDVMKEKSVTKSKGNNSLNEVICNGHGDDDDDEMPPGFGSPCKDETCSVASVSTDTNREAVVIGHPQERYRAHLSVSYGLPITLMQQQGTDITKCTNPFDSSLSIAPSMPFRPFPPLPSYPRQWPASNNVSNRSYGNSNYRQANQRPGFPKYGNVRRFFEPQQQKNLRSQRFWSQGGR